MSFAPIAARYSGTDLSVLFDRVTAREVRESLDRAGDIHSLHTQDLVRLLSPAAQDFLEPMAQKARALTLQYFGRTIGLYAPLYISDFCCNHCTYCGFNAKTGARRTRLDLDQIEEEARAISAQGIRHVLVLTGEAPEKTPMTYLEEALGLLSKYFASIGLEIFPMPEEDYRRLIRAGADTLTVYQEVYDPVLYKAVHPKGPKADYAFRLDTPERAARAGFRAVNIGPLFGLGDPRAEAFLAGLHARYLERAFPDIEVALSLPRMTQARGGIAPGNILSDKGFVQTLLAWRLFMPRLGLTISTRESAAFRDRLIHLGVTRYSAGSKTDVGGYAVYPRENTVQFEVTDTRSVAEVVRMIRESGYQPVFKDWEMIRA